MSSNRAATNSGPKRDTPAQRLAKAVLTVLLVFPVASGMAGCSEDREADSAQPPAATGGTGTTGAQAASEEQRPRRKVQDADGIDDGPVPQDSRTTTLPSGAVAITPPRPTQTSTEPGRHCAVLKTEKGRTLYAPPRPGVRAVRTADGRILATVEFHDLPRRCQPVKVRLTLDVNDEVGGNISRLYRIRGRRQQIRLTLPRYYSGAPDVVGASAVGWVKGVGALEGPSVKVLITEP
jgi:hypothetical protein